MLILKCYNKMITSWVIVVKKINADKILLIRDIYTEWVILIILIMENIWNKKNNNKNKKEIQTK